MKFGRASLSGCYEPLCLRPDFGIWLNGKKLSPSKEDKGLIRRWVLGKELTELPRPSPEGITTVEDEEVNETSEHRFGLYVPDLGRITEYAEVYDLLTGKSDQLGRAMVSSFMFTNAS